MGSEGRWRGVIVGSEGVGTERRRQWWLVGSEGRSVYIGLAVLLVVVVVVSCSCVKGRLWEWGRECYRESVHVESWL